MLHRPTPARETQCSPEHHVARIDAVDLGVGHAVAVGVSLERRLLPLDLDNLVPDMIEELLTGHIDDLAATPIAGVVEPCQQYPARAPGKFVAEGVVVGLGRRQSSAIRLEGSDLPTLRVHAVDDLHGRHVVNAGVDAELVEEDDPLFLGPAVERLHVLLDVRRGHHVPACTKACLCNLGVELPRQQADGNVVIGNDGLELFRLGRDIERHWSTIRVAVDNRLRLAHRAAGDGHVESVIEKVAHVSSHHQPGSKHDNSFHMTIPFERRSPPPRRDHR